MNLTDLRRRIGALEAAGTVGGRGVPSLLGDLRTPAVEDALQHAYALAMTTPAAPEDRDWLDRAMKSEAGIEALAQIADTYGGINDLEPKGEAQ